MQMDESAFEGSLILEKLAAVNLVDEFFEAIDADDFAKAASLMKRAGVDGPSIAVVLQKMADSDGKH